MAHRRAKGRASGACLFCFVYMPITIYAFGLALTPVEFQSLNCLHDEHSPRAVWCLLNAPREEDLADLAVSLLFLGRASDASLEGSP